MNSFDNELLLLSKIEIELSDNKGVSIATLEDYKDFIEANYDITESTKDYVLQEVLNRTARTRDRVAIANTISNIETVLGRQTDITTELVFAMLDCVNKSYGDIDEPYEVIKNVKLNNVYANLSVVRLLLAVALFRRNLADIKSYSAKLEEAITAHDEVMEGVTWTVGDFNV